MSDLTIQVLTIVGSNIVIVIGMLSINVGIWIHQDKKIDEHRQETNDIIAAIHKDGKEFQNAILQEMKDFHGRLCTIEEGRKK